MAANADASTRPWPRREAGAQESRIRRLAARALAPDSIWSAVTVWCVWATAVLAAFAASQIVRLYDPWQQFAVERTGFLWPARSWDYGHYLSIARDWYPQGESAVEYAFFPLWGSLLALGEETIGAAAFGTLLTIATSAAVFIGVAYLNPLASVRRTAIALACMPTSYVLLLVYPDGLALAAAVWACVFALRNNWAAATALGLVAALARPNGFLVAIALLFLARNSTGRLRWVAVAAPPMAFVAVMTYFWQRSGDLFAFTAAQRWARGHPWELPLSVFESPARMWDGLLALLAIGLCVLAWRSPMARVWPVYATAVLAMSLGSGTVWGIARHMLFAFPLVWAASTISLGRRTWALAALGACLSVEQAFIIQAIIP